MCAGLVGKCVTDSAGSMLVNPGPPVAFLIMSHGPSELELEATGRTLAVPTRDDQVIRALREYGERLELSESAASRRKRLLLIMARRHLQGQAGDAGDAGDAGETGQEGYKESYSTASDELFRAREQIASSATLAAKARIETQLEQAQAVDTHNLASLKARYAEIDSQISALRRLECRGIEAGFARPVSGVAFINDALHAGDWSGKIYTINADTVEIASQNQVHTGKVCLASWRHGLLSGGLEGEIHTAGAVLKSSHRVASVDGHPLLDLVAGAYFDKTWKLWDLESGSLLLSQTGHAKEVYTAKFHPDGSLLASGGLDGKANIWDLRSGKPVMALENHVREIYAMDWCSDGYTLATGGADNNIIVWDIRARADRMIPAHTSIVSSIKVVGSAIISGSYDKTIKAWNLRTGTLISTKTLHDKVMSLDVRGSVLAAGKWDRTLDVWA